MKMGCCGFFSGFFWGVLILLFGLSIILKTVFNVNIPLVRIFFAIILIYLGIKMLTGNCWSKPNWRVFSKTEISSTESIQKEYSVVFGSANIDLSGIAINKDSVSTEINVVFGSAILKVNPAVPTKIILNSAFAGAKTPDGNTTAMGKYVYTTPSYKEGTPCLLIEADAVFSSLDIVGI